MCRMTAARAGHTPSGRVKAAKPQPPLLSIYDMSTATAMSSVLVPDTRSGTVTLHTRSVQVRSVLLDRPEVVELIFDSQSDQSGASACNVVVASPSCQLSILPPRYSHCAATHRCPPYAVRAPRHRSFLRPVAEWSCGSPQLVWDPAPRGVGLWLSSVLCAHGLEAPRLRARLWLDLSEACCSWLVGTLHAVHPSESVGGAAADVCAGSCLVPMHRRQEGGRLVARSLVGSSAARCSLFSVFVSVICNVQRWCWCVVACRLEYERAVAARRRLCGPGGAVEGTLSVRGSGRGQAGQMITFLAAYVSCWCRVLIGAYCALWRLGPERFGWRVADGPGSGCLPVGRLLPPAESAVGEQEGQCVAAGSRVEWLSPGCDAAERLAAEWKLARSARSRWEPGLGELLEDAFGVDAGTPGWWRAAAEEAVGFGCAARVARASRGALRAVAEAGGGSRREVGGCEAGRGGATVAEVEWQEGVPGAVRLGGVCGGGVPTCVSRWEALEVEEVSSEEEEEVVSDEAQAEAGPRRRQARGPRAPREVRDAMRPVSRRGATSSARIVTGHVRFLQLVFRRMGRRAGERSARCVEAPRSAWARGGMAGLWPPMRPVVMPRCRYGRRLAGRMEFERQAQVAQGAMAWYRQYVELLRKLLGRAPGFVDLFCGGGGCTEGVRRSGFSGVGVDLEEQRDFVRRFGEAAFVQGDALSAAVIREAAARCGAVGVGASPPLLDGAGGWQHGDYRTLDPTDG